MRKRQYRYFATNALIKTASKLTRCIEFPHFGAHYPDACCHKGYLYDLDSYDETEGGCTSGGDDPCPCCNTKTYIKDMLDNEVGMGRIVAHLLYIFSRYGQTKTI